MDADELYQRPPEEFVAARGAAVKSLKAAGDAAGAKALSALRKPSVAAWLVNRLAAGQGELLDQLLALGPALAEAQSRGRAEDLRSLGQQRRQLVEAVTDSAIAGAGRSVTAAVREEVSATLEAALADSASAQAVRSRRLVRSLSYAGFGTVDLAGAVAEDVHRTRPPSAQKTAAPAARQEAVAAAELAAHRAAGRLDDAVSACEKVARRLSAAIGALHSAHAEVARARAALDAAEQGQAAAQAAQARAQQESDDAVQAVRAAQDEAEAARSTLDRLRREPSDC